MINSSSALPPLAVNTQAINNNSNNNNSAQQQHSMSPTSPHLPPPPPPPVCDISFILSHDDTKLVFQTFLGFEFNTEPLEFINEVDRLEKMPFPSPEAVKAAISICNTYFVPLYNMSMSAPKEINVNSEVRSSVIAALLNNNQFQNENEWVTSPTPAKLYESAKDRIKFDLNQESVPRFLKSKLYAEFLKCTLKNYL